MYWRELQRSRSKCSLQRRSKGSLRRIPSLGAFGEGSGWDLRVHRRRRSVRKSGNLEIWNPTKSKGIKHIKMKSVLPKMSARSGVEGKQNILTLFHAISGIFSMGRKNRKHAKKITYFCYSTALGPLLLSTLGGDVVFIFDIYKHAVGLTVRRAFVMTLRPTAFLT